MPKNMEIQTIVVIGSGPIKIGQAAEFDYAGTQACLSLKESGYKVILINSNPATIMTDSETADQVFIEPLTLPSVTKILEQTRPDALLPTLGGQTGLNLAVALDDAGVLQRLNIQLLGTSLTTINQAEDRQAFKTLMLQLGQPVPASLTVHDAESALTFATKIGYPVIVRPAYTLGGTGGGIANNSAELQVIAERGLTMSPATECLIEKSIAGFKEIEYEVMRDNVGNKIVVCNMENFDPVGIHTGDSIVYAPSQTLSDQEYQTLRDASFEIVEALKIQGGCNVQLAQDPTSSAYYVIEVNPRVSRSSALASKATGYPIAKIAAKIAVGLNLTEITNPVTKTTTAAFEPALDYVVAKIPRFPFDKFPTADAHLGTQMKATGEVMAIGTTIEEATLKAIASLETDQVSLAALKPTGHFSAKTLKMELQQPTDQRLFALMESLRLGESVANLAQLTKITPFFLTKLAHIVTIQQSLRTPNDSALQTAKKYGFSNTMIAMASGQHLPTIEAQLTKLQLHPVYKMVDTCAGEFASDTPYFYSTYFGTENESKPLGKSILVLGSGPIRIGQGVEFDYTTVHSVREIQKAGYRAIVVNNNPETVSTDFSISDKLYFEPLTYDSLSAIIQLEQPLGVIVQFGGQTAINLASQLAEQGVKILGTDLADIDLTEDRGAFAELLKSLNIPQATGKAISSVAAAKQTVAEIGLPVLVRPSFVLGGRGMAIIHNEQELVPFVQQALAVNSKAPVLIDRYIQGIECEVDILGDGHEIFIPGIMEHLEGAGVHSGDSIAVYPPQHLTIDQQKKICQIATELGQAVHCVGMMNIQLVVADQIYVIDVNPRASRTVPFMSKNTGLPLAQLATRLILGDTLTDLKLLPGLLPAKELVSIKAPVFSFNKLPGMQMVLSPEMKSTGETMGRGTNFVTALTKALQDSYQIQNWQPAAGIISDEASLTAQIQHELTDAGIKWTVWHSADVQFSKLTAKHQLVFATDIAAQPILEWGLSHALPVITAGDTLSTILETPPVSI